jgi:hypothetical protein
LLVGGALGFARAQTPYPQQGGGPVNRPTYSPYLNLLRQGNPTYANYYGLVRPEVDLRAAAAGLQQQVAANQQGIANLQTAPGLLTTGHATRFLSTSGYFLNRGGPGAGQVNRLGLAAASPTPGGLAAGSPAPGGFSQPAGPGGSPPPVSR